MNQQPRYIISKCSKCGIKIIMPQLYDKHNSMYVNCRLNMCIKCCDFDGCQIK